MAVCVPWRSELSRRAVQLAMTRDEVAAQSAAAIHAQAESDRWEAVFTVTFKRRVLVDTWRTAYGMHLRFT